MKILSAENNNLSSLSELRNLSIEEGYRFLERLISEWKNGKNRFEKPGEGFYHLYLEEKLIGVGGINIDPYLPNLNYGRIRRFYIHPDYRRKAYGKKLIQHIIETHKDDYDALSLKTDTSSASLFYESLGFKRIVEASTHTHLLRM